MAIRNPNADESIKEYDELQTAELDNITTQLAQKVGLGKKAELEDLSPSVLSAIEGGEGTSFSLLSIPQRNSVTWDKTTFILTGKNKYNPLRDMNGTFDWAGQVVENDARSIIDYIPIQEGDAVYLSYFNGTSRAQFGNRIVVYDKQKNVLEVLEYVSGTPITTTGASYVRTSIGKIILSERFMVSLNEFPPYEDYIEYFNNVKIFKDDVIGLNEALEVSGSHLQGQKMVCFGDSITGNFFENDYPSVIANRTGMEVYNVGFGGSRLGRHWGEFDKFSFYNLVDNVISGNFENLKEPFDDRPATYDERVSILESIDFSNVDYVSIAYGANDWPDNTPNDKTDKEDPTSFIGAGRLGLRKLLEAYPHLKVLVISPFYRYFPLDVPITDSDEKSISNFILAEYVASAEKVANEFKSPFYNAYYNLGINKYTRSEYFSGNDGTHHDVIGRKLIGDKLSSFILSNF